jgi:5'-nucleotidase
MIKRILLSNDDGVFATGLKEMHNHLSKKYEVDVIAPDRNCSGFSSSLTLSRPLEITKYNSFFCVNGTPSDCTHLGTNGVLGDKPDIVVSGINAGANLGDDTIYSGTVAAAIEGRFLPYTAMAVSLCGNNNFETAARVIMELLKDIKKLQLPNNTILNINVPDISFDEIQGIEITRLGYRGSPQKPTKIANPRNIDGYWLGNVGEPIDFGIGTDFHAIANKKVSITPIKIDMTEYDSFHNMTDWISKSNILFNA